MNCFSPDVYAEVYEILSYMDKQEVMKIPYELLEDIKNSRNKNYISKIDILDIYNRENVLPDTIKVLAALDLEYFSSNVEKKRLNENLTKNVELKKYNSKEIFKNRQNNLKTQISTEKEETNLVTYKNKKWYQRIFATILNLFKKN